MLENLFSQSVEWPLTWPASTVLRRSVGTLQFRPSHLAPSSSHPCTMQKNRSVSVNNSGKVSSHSPMATVAGSTVCTGHGLRVCQDHRCSTHISTPSPSGLCRGEWKQSECRVQIPSPNQYQEGKVSSVLQICFVSSSLPPLKTGSVQS